MHSKIEQHHNTAARHGDAAGSRGKTLPAVPALAVQRKQLIVQMAPLPGEMNAKAGELKENYDRKLLADRIYARIKNEDGQWNFTNVVNGKRFLNAQTQGAPYVSFNAEGAGEQTAITKELCARVYHDQTASGEITGEMRTKLGKGLELDEEDGPAKSPDITASSVKPEEIKSNMTTAKACVITALMFAEGGGVLGARSVEELHFILSTRFNTTWRHYSEDAVFKSLYEHLGYTKTVPPVERSLENLGTTIGGIRTGMASIGGHMVGFKKDGADMYIRDNDEGLKKADEHSRKTEMVVDYWHK
ncbi:hypothetical protein HDF19_12420 [Mucilaginibacter sp. E4BP6]|uniref:hypothetical protein n=1 Tax=Mucilaginibacter sp. E4BP6 TaxID=2723089 RepID=UPI0015C8DF50|nr:hypothetical protein [Mucilaginibacter sp. E4BP6]NYE65029.1 hypothetical protein [Mucilaginibacter sp. E4BP6]